MASKLETVSRTERVLLNLRNKMLAQFPDLTPRHADMLALAGAAAALQCEATCKAAGMVCQIDRAELLTILDRIQAQAAKKARS